MRRSAILVVYVLISLLVLAIWARGTLTERPQEAGPGAEWGNLSRMIDGTAPTPFVTRRLLPDAAALIARLVPRPVWNWITVFIHSDSAVARPLRAVLDKMFWKPRHYPELFSGYFLIWLSILGFMLTCRRLARFHYDMPDWTADIIGILFGIGLLGGMDGRWGGYTYDFPNAFLFTLTLYAVFANRWWLLPSFAAAVYCKETSLLLIIAFAIVHLEKVRQWTGWATLVVMIGLYGAIRAWISSRYHTPPGGDFWFPERNAAFLGKTMVYQMWWGFIVVVVFARLVMLRHEIPRNLSRLVVVLCAVLFAAAFFKGWIEERRQYLEVYPVVGLILLQWAALELGLSRWFRPKSNLAEGKSA